MLSNNRFLETRIQQLLDGLILVEKGLGVHVQGMLEMSRGLYERRKIEDLVCNHDLTN